jgi:hypothetical protein
VWIYQDKPGLRSSQCIAKISDLPHLTPTVCFKIRADVISKSIMDYFDEKHKDVEKYRKFSYGPRELADRIIDDLIKDTIQNGKSVSSFTRKLLIEKISYQEKNVLTLNEQ